MHIDGVAEDIRHWIHLLIPAFSAHAVLASALAFVPPQCRLLRASGTILTAAICLETIRRRRPGSVEEADFGDYMFGVALHSSCYLLIKDLEPAETLRTKTEKLKWAVPALFSVRMGVAPPWRDPPDMTKSAFVLRRSAVALAGLLAWSRIRGLALLPNDFGPWDVTPDKDSMISQLLAGTFGLRELWIRAAIVLSGHSGSALVINTAHCVFSVLAVSILGSPMADWPPLFGSIFDAYSVRRYYSHFWHKMMRKAFTLHAVILVERAFGLRKGKAAGRSVIVLVSFFISGMMHTITGWTPGPCQSIRPLWGYVQVGLVIIVEEAAQRIYKKLRRMSGIRRTKAEVTWWRLFGYCWVVFYWLASTGPVYKSMRCSYQHLSYE